MQPTQLRIYKSLLRNKIRHAINQLSPRQRDQKSRKIVHKLLRNDVFRRAQVVMVYASMDSEVRTFELMKRVLDSGKTLVLPRISKLGRLDIYSVSRLRDLEVGRFQIREPMPSQCCRISAKQIDLVICPGMAFDASGRRLGRGAGYYDRFLSQLNGSCLVGLGFREQKLSKIPSNQRDVRMHRVITD